MATSPGSAAIRCAIPAILLAALTLVPFLNTPFTIDDPLFLTEANHILEDPLHPQAVDIVWTLDEEMRASNVLPGGALAPYILVPTALAGNREWVAHLTQIALLAIALFGTSLVALRLGLERRGATIAALLTASAPAVLGMAGTAMPDVATLTFGVLGMERLLAWRNDGKWHQAAMTTVWLTIAAFMRAHAALLVVAAAAFLLDGISLAGIRSSLKLRRFAPLLAVPLVYLLVGWITADPLAATDRVAVRQIFLGLRPVGRNVFSFFTHWFFMAPLAIPWQLIRRRAIDARLSFAVAAAAFAASLLGMRLIAFVGAAGALVILDIFGQAIRARDPNRLALALWLLPPLATVIYIQLPAKYIVPMIPAAAILVVQILPKGGAKMERWLPRCAVAAGVGVSLLVLTGTRALAENQREAVRRLIVPRVAAGESVWFTGHWGFHWYAEAAGAKPAVLEGNTPRPGDTVVVSLIDAPLFAVDWTRKRVVDRVTLDSVGRVMDMAAGAGFFSNVYGYLPWVASHRDTNVFEVWKVE